MNARLRPWAEISRRTMISRPSGRVEDRLDGGGLLAGPDEVGGSAAADQERDRPDEDRLAGAGLAS